MSGPAAILIGPMGSGKSTVGALLAERLGCDFRDTDTDVEQGTGRSISDIFLESGEEAFRALERAAVAAAVAEHRGVLALGGGAVLAEPTREVLAGQPVVYLRVGLGEAVKRVGLGAGRPMLLGNVRAQVKKLLDERDPIYRSVARWSIETDDRVPADVAAEIAGLLAPHSSTGEVR
jgi:shikimate kinase